MHDLDSAEVRVLGCLLEKQLTTPDTYPLTLNALRLAANQTTNRTPVVSYDDATVQTAVQRLGQRRLTRLTSGHTTRAPKYRHLLREELGLQPEEQAVLSVLLLRGPQTPGELKQRTERMHPFADLAAVEQVLGALTERGLGAWHDRRPGQKEARYAHLLQADDVAVEQPLAPPPRAPAMEPPPPPRSATEPRPSGEHPFVHRLRVRYNECDPQNVVFNANYFTYFDVTITELWRAACGSYDAMLQAGADLMVVEARARYLAPARFDDQLEIGVGIAHIGTTSLVVRVFVNRDGDALAEGELRYVFIDPATQSKREPPPDIRSAIERYVIGDGSPPAQK
jgi:YbgC/YbaW family acyl-CoA thioester hydrolase